MPTSRFDNVASISKQTVPGSSTAWAAPAILAFAETTVFTFVVPVGKEFLLDRAGFIGSADAVCTVKVEAVAIEFMELAWTMRSDVRYFPYGHKILAGETLTITILNKGSGTCDFQGSVHGRLIDA